MRAYEGTAACRPGAPSWAWCLDLGLEHEDDGVFALPDASPLMVDLIGSEVVAKEPDAPPVRWPSFSRRSTASEKAVILSDTSIVQAFTAFVGFKQVLMRFSYRF